jgi:Cu+-exporting ATPase
MRMPAQTPTESKSAQDAVQSSQTGLVVEGMTCGNCARHVSEAIQSVAGVRAVNVDLEAHHASVRWSSGSSQDVASVIKAVEAAGYKARIQDTEAHDCKHDLAGWELNLWVGVLGTFALMLGEWGLGLAAASWFQWFSFAVGAVVQAVAGAPFYRGAWAQLKSGNSNMDTLVVLGSTTAFGYSAWALLSRAGGHLYFMEAAAIITLISLGHWVESRVSTRASAALRQLLNLAPAQARKRNPDGTETVVPVPQLKVNDLVLLRPGDRIPTDGEVSEGASAVDESMLTGESIPVEKTVGSKVYAGTTNLNGRLMVRVTATDENTALAHIIAAVQRAQNSRANIQRLGDRVSSVFVPIVVAVALAAGLWWGLAPEQAHHTAQWLSQYLWLPHPPTGVAAGFIIAASVLIIACPCAMGLATPAAIMAGANAAAQRGILIRDGVALEKAGVVTAVLFDKTGTLTIGKPNVVDVWQATDSSKATERTEAHSDIVKLAASLAAHSNHPISQAIASLKPGRMELQNWREIPGAGIQGQVDQPNAPKGEVQLGSLTWLRATGVDLAAGENFVQKWTTQAATMVGLAVSKSLVALFAVNDSLKPGAARVVKAIQRQGLKVFLVTGDNSLTALSIARLAGIPETNVFAEVRPEMKAEFVKKLQARNERVAFVGDGINDAPALEQADLGIAVSKASDIAREAADIILLKSEIEAVPESLGLAKATLRTIKQNLFWAFFYNAVGIPLAALGFMTPILCAAAMGFSDIIVIGNALRLRRWKMRE